MGLIVVAHPLVRHKLGLLRENDTTTSKFRSLTREVTNLLTYEATRDMMLSPHVIDGWAGQVTVERLAGKKVVVVPILRAGLGMMQGVLDLIPSARVNLIGLFRDELTLNPVEYYKKFNPDIADRTAIIVDPMLATGRSMAVAADLLKAENCTRIKAICIVAAPEGVAEMEQRHSDIDIYTGALDTCLNKDAYILPGLGDAGDRLFGTR